MTTDLALVLYAIQTKPGGYTLEDVPNAYIRVAADYIPQGLAGRCCYDVNVEIQAVFT